MDRGVRLTGLLQAWARGDVEARDALAPLVYDELRRRAAAYLRRERPGHTLQPTALVHEAFVRLIGQQHVVWQGRAHFFAVAAQMMRRVLVDHARERQAAKRARTIRVELNDQIGSSPPADCEVLLLDQALDDLARLDARQARVVELRYFGGLSEQEVGAVLSLSRATVTREWQSARAWLYRRITTGARDHAGSDHRA
jgi:RNA polymerase sigma factor (TIGR02999 family)